MDRMYLNRPLLIKILLFYLLLCVVFSRTAGHQFDYKTYNLVSERIDDTVGEIVDGKNVMQYFHYEGDYIRAFQVMAGTYMRQNHGKLHIALLDEEGVRLWQAEKELQEIEDNAVLEFSPDCMLEQGTDTFCLEIRSEGCREGDAVTLYCGMFADQSAGSLIVSDDNHNTFADQDGKTLFIQILGEQKYPWYGYYWHAVVAAGILLFLFYALQRGKERQGKPCMLYAVCSTLDTYRFLIKQLVVRDFKTKYKRSVLGACWSLLNPLCTMAVQYIVFSTIFRSNIRNYPVYLLSASVLFNFFTESVGGGLVSIVGNATLITKVYVPKYIYPVTKVLSTAVNLMISMLPLLAVVLITGEQVTAAYALIPYVFVCLMLFCVGMSLFLAALMVFFRDMQFLWGIISLLWMYATPLFYPQEIIPERFRFVLSCNPMYHYISFFRTILLEHTSPQLGEYFTCMAFSVGVCMAGIWFFQHYQKRFALYL